MYTFLNLWHPYIKVESQLRAATRQIHRTDERAKDYFKHLFFQVNIELLCST